MAPLAEGQSSVHRGLCLSSSNTSCKIPDEMQLFSRNNFAILHFFLNRGFLTFGVCETQPAYVLSDTSKEGSVRIRQTYNQTADLSAQEDDVRGLAGFSSSFPVQLSDFLRR